VWSYTSAQEPTFVSPSTSGSHISTFPIERFLADKVALGQFCLPVLRFSSVSSILPMLQTHFHLHVACTRSNKFARTGNLLERRVLSENLGGLDRKVLVLSVGSVYLQQSGDRKQFHLINLTLECPLAPQHDINTEFNT